MTKDCIYYIYEEIKTKRIRIAKNKDVLLFEIRQKQKISEEKLKMEYSIIGEIYTNPFGLYFYGIENFERHIKAAATNALCRIIGI